jgi:hypothetical protein
MRVAEKHGRLLYGRQVPDAGPQTRIDWDPEGPRIWSLPPAGTATVSIAGNIVDALTQRVPYRIEPDGALTMTLTIPGTERGTVDLVIQTEP